MVGDYLDTRGRGNVGMSGMVFLENSRVTFMRGEIIVTVLHHQFIHPSVNRAWCLFLTTGKDQTAVTARIISK